MAEGATENSNIICTFPEPEKTDFADLLRQHNFNVLFLPAIAIRPLPYRLKKSLADYDWIVFTSKNGVKSFQASLNTAKLPRIAVLGAATAKALKKLQIEPDFEGSGHSASSLAEELKPLIQARASILLVLGKLAPDTLQAAFETHHWVERINVYETIVPEKLDPQISHLLETDAYELLLVSSPSAIKNLYLAFRSKIVNWRLISIGSTTTEACQNLGIAPLVTAKDTSYLGMAQSALEYLQQKNNKL